MHAQTASTGPVEEKSTSERANTPAPPPILITPERRLSNRSLDSNSRQSSLKGSKRVRFSPSVGSFDSIMSLLTGDHSQTDDGRGFYLMGLDLKRTAIWMIGWECSYEFSRFLLHFFQVSGRKSSSSLAAQASSVNRLVSNHQIASYVVSTLHAVFVGYRGIKHLSSFVGAPVEEQLMILDNERWGEIYQQQQAQTTPSTLDEHDHEKYLAEQMRIEETCRAFVGYLVIDLAHVLAVYPALGKLDVVAHHSLFISAGVLASMYRILPFPFSWLIVGELSTILLNIRWLFKNLMGKSSRTLNMAFALVFFLTRNVIYSAGVGHLLLHHSKVIRTPKLVVRYIAGLLVAGLGLNTVWLTKILALAGILRRRKKVSQF